MSHPAAVQVSAGFKFHQLPYVKIKFIAVSAKLVIVTYRICVRTRFGFKNEVASAPKSFSISNT